MSESELELTWCHATINKQRCGTVAEVLGYRIFKDIIKDEPFDMAHTQCLEGHQFLLSADIMDENNNAIESSA